MIFNDIDFKEYFIVENINRCILPPINSKTIKIIGKNGSKFRKNEFGELVIDVDIRMLAKNRTELQEKTRELASKLNTKELKKLYLDDEIDKYYLATLSEDTNVEKLGMTGGVTLSFLCPDPIAFGDTKTVTLNKDTIISNIGTEPTTGIITINVNQSINNIQVTLQNTGEYIYLGHNFVVGDTVVINLGEETAYKNDNSIMKDCYLESDFFDIPVGEFKITTNVENATLEYVERWL